MRLRALTFFASATALALSMPAAAQVDENETNNQEENLELQEVIVVGTDQSRYVTQPSDAISGITLDFLENPRSVTSIQEQLLLDRKITFLEEALRNAPSVVAGDGFGGTRDDFFIRGFRRNAEYRDGFRRQTIFRTNLANVETVEVIRGPAAITFGQVAPGGVVNVVTKRPLDERRISGEARYGTFDDRFLLLDWSQPLSDKAAVRVVGSIQDAESFRDFTDINRDSLAISGKYDITPQTTLGLAYEYRNEGRPLDRGTFGVTTANGVETVNDLLDIPFSRRFGEPFEDFQVDFNYYEARLEHSFNEDWNLRAAIAYEDSLANDIQARQRGILIADGDDARISDDGFISATVADPTAFFIELLGNTFDAPTDRIFLRKRPDGTVDRDSQALHLNALVNGEFDTGAINHRVAFGADYREVEVEREFAIGPESDGFTVPFFNIVDGAYVLPSERPLATPSTQDGDDFGFFANTYSTIGERLGVLLGIRYAETEQESTFGTSVTPSSSDAWIPQAGLTFKAADNISLYASYAESFQPNNERVLGGIEPEPIDPTTGEQIEAGVKAEFFDNRLQTQAAIYQIDLTNVFDRVDANDRPVFVDGQTSKGVELSVAGQPIPGMNVTAAYAYTDAELSNGNQAAITPEQAINIYASYEIQSGQFEGVGFGGGVFHENNRFGNSANTFDLGDYTLVDGSLWYTITAPQSIADDGTIRFQLAVKNLFDEEYFQGTSNFTRIPLGIPRTVFGSVSFDF